MGYEYYFWREEGEIPPAADSLLERLSEDRNLPGVDRLSLVSIHDAFSLHFPGIAARNSGMEWETGDVSFQVSFHFDGCKQPISICIRSESALHEIPDISSRLFAAIGDIGCTRIESHFK